MKRPTSLDLNLAVAHGLRADWFCADRLGFVPDDWQGRVLRSRSRQVAICAGRQVGKSTVVAGLALAGSAAAVEPGPFPVESADATRSCGC